MITTVWPKMGNMGEGERQHGGARHDDKMDGQNGCGLVSGPLD